MNTQPQTHKEPSLVRDFGVYGMHLLWQAVRLPVFALLVILEPVVRIVLGGFALLCVLMAFLFEFSGVAPNFPFWMVLSVGIGSAVLLTFYHALIRWLSR